MAFDGIVTYGMARELAERLTFGKIEKIYQPGNEELLLQIHTRTGNVRLLASCGSQSARLCLTEEKYRNPEQPPNFCMLLRKHIQGGRITEIRQNGSERILELDIEAQTELGFSVSRRLIVEIMGKHSNIVLLDLESGKIIDAIKRISIDVNRYRQLLPGILYKYPPAQNRTPFKEIACDDPSLDGMDAKVIMSRIAGISPAVAAELSAAASPSARLAEILDAIENDRAKARVYVDEKGTPREFHLTALREFAPLTEHVFETLSACVEYFYQHRASSNLIRQKALPLHRVAKAALEKAELKKQRLSEDLLRAEDSDRFRLYGELLTANLHCIKPGAEEVTLVNYYDGQPLSVPLSAKLSAAKNAQQYFKKYAKAKTAVKEKTAQLAETETDLAYLESVLLSLDSAESESQLDQIRDELVETGYLRFRAKPGLRRKKAKADPIRYTLSDGSVALVGRNNRENDHLTMTYAGKTDVWFHTKDIPGSHVILPMKEGRSVADLPAELIYEVASIAAYHSKARASANVPVDYVPVRHIRKPNGAKPGMVIFTHNATVYVDPKLPE